MTMNLIRRCKARYRMWRSQRYLKKHGCDSWRQYARQYDADYCGRATQVQDIYQGYPYVYCFENHEHEVYYWDLGRDGTYVVNDWCEKNCRAKHRLDFLRVIKAPSTGNHWAVNEIGGSDYIFAAFKDERDFLIFLLRWS